jgi:hypothetical protein
MGGLPFLGCVAQVLVFGLGLCRARLSDLDLAVD